jgi:hypothetical protein
MNAEDKKIGEDVGALSDESIVLLKRLIKMLSPITITSASPFNELKLEAASDGGFGFSTVAGTIPIVTSINQLGGCGLVASRTPITLINTTPVYGGWNYTVGDIVTLSGGTGGSVMVNSVDNIGSVVSLSLYTAGSGYSVGNTYQFGDTVRLPDTPFEIFDGISGATMQMISTVASTNGMGLIVNIVAVDTGYGNNNFLQSDIARWLYSDMIQSQIN